MTNTIELSSDGLKKLNDGLDKLVASMDRLDATMTRLVKQNRSAFENIFGSTQDFSKLINSVNTLSTDGGKAFVKITETVRDLVKELNKLPDNAAAKLLPVRDLLTVLANFQAADSRSVENLNVATRAVRNLVYGFNNLNLQKLDNSSIKHVANLMDSLFKTLNSIPSIATAFPGAESLQSVSRIFSALGNGLVQLQKISRSFSTKDAIRLAAMFGGLATTFKAIAIVVRALPGQNAFDDLSKTLQKLSSGLLNLSKASKNFTGLSDVVKLGQIFTALTASFSVLSGLLKILPGSKAFASFAQSLNQLATGLRVLSEFGEVKVGKATFNVLKDVVKIIRPLFSALSGLKTKEVPDFGKIFGSVFEAIEKLSGRRIGKIDTRTLKEAMSGLADALNSFNRVRVDEKKLRATAELISALFTNTGQFSVSSGERIGRNFGGSITRSFTEALRIDRAVQFVFASIGKIVTNFNPATLYLRIGQGLDQFINNAISKVKQLGDTLSTVGQRLQTFGISVFNTLGLKGLANSGAFQLATDFDALSTQVKVFGDLTDDQLKSAQAFANEIGIKYPQSANDALVGILNLQKAGLSLTEVYSALPAAADLSALSDTKNLDLASRAIISVTQQFKNFNDEFEGSFENADVAANILARAANLSTASVESLVDGLNNVGPVANSVGLDLEETSAILSILEDAGIRGAEGGTQLKSMLTSLLTGTSESKKALRQLGVTLVDNEGNFKDINTILNELNTALNTTKTVTTNAANLTGEQKARLDAAQKAYAAAARQVLIYNDGLATGALDQENANEKLAQLQQVQANASAVIAEITGSQSETERITRTITRTQAQNAATIKALAGSYGQAGLNILLSAGEDAIKNFIEETGRLPTAAEQAALLLDNLKGDVEQFRGSIETLMTRALLPLIGRAFRPMVQVGRVVVDFFNSLPDSVFDAASSMVLLVSTIATFAGGALVAVGVATQFAGVILTGVAAFLTMATNLGLVIAGLAGLAASFATLIVVGTAIFAVVAALSTGLTSFFRTIEGNVGGAGDAFDRLKDTLGGIASGIGEIFRVGGDIISLIFGDSLSNSSVQQGEKIAAFIDRITNSLTGVSQNVNSIKLFAQGFRDFLSLNNAGAQQETIYESLLAQGVPATVAMQAATQQMSRMKKALSDIVIAVGTSGLFARIFGRSFMPSEVIALFGGIERSLIGFRNSILLTFKGVSGTLLNALGVSDDPQAKLQLKQGLSELSSIVLEGVQAITGLDLSEALLSFKSGDIRKGARSLLTLVSDNLKSAILSNEDGIKKALGQFFSFFLPGRIAPRILHFLGLDEVASALEGGFNFITKIFENSVGVLFDVLGGESFIEALINNFGPGITPILSLIFSLQNAFGAIQELIASIFAVFTEGSSGQGAAQFFSNIIFGLAEGFNELAAILRRVTPTLVGVAQVIKGVIDFTSRSPALRRLGNAFLVIVSGLSGLSVASRGAIGLNQLFKVLRIFSGVLKGLAAPIALIAGLVVGLKSFYDAVQEGGDLFTILGNTFSNFAETLLSFFGIEIDFDQLLSGLFSTIQGAINAIPDLLDELSAATGFGFLSTAADALRTGDFGGIISAIGDGLRAALNIAGATLERFGSEIGSPLIEKIGTALQSGNYQPVLDEIINGILALVSSVPQALIDIGNAIGAPLITEIGTALSTGDYLPVLTNIAAGVSAAISLAGTTIADVGYQIGSGFLVALGEYMAIGDFLGVVNTLIHGVRTAIPLALEAAGDFFGIPLFDHIATGLREGDIGVILDALLTLFVDGLSTFFTDTIPQTLTTLGLTLNLDFLTDLGVTLDQSAAFEQIINAIINIISYPIEVFNTVVGAIADLAIALVEVATGQNERAANNLKLVAAAVALFSGYQLVTNLPLVLTFLAGLSPVLLTVGAIGGSIAILVALGSAIMDLAAGRNTDAAANLLLIAGALAAFTAIGAIKNAYQVGLILGRMLPVIQTLGGAVARFAALVVIFVTIKNVIEEVVNFLSGDKNIFQAFFDAAIGIVEDLAGFLGADNFFGLSFDDIRTTAYQAAFILEDAFNTAFSNIGRFFQQIVDGIAVRLQLLKAQVDIVSPDQATRTQAGAFFALNDILGKADITNSLQAFQGAFDTGIERTVIEAAARLNFQPFQDAFTRNISNLAELSDRDFAGLITGLVSSNGFDEAVAQIPDDAMRPFFERLLTVPPDAFRIMDISQVGAAIRDGLASGQIDIDLARALIWKIPDEVLSPSQKIELISKIVSEIGATPPASVEVDVDPDVTVSNPEEAIDKVVRGLSEGAATVTRPNLQVKPDLNISPEDAAAAVKQANAVFTENGLAAEVPMAPAPTFDASSIQTPEDAALMTQNLLLLQAQADLTKPSLDALTLSSQGLDFALQTLVTGSLTRLQTTLAMVRTNVMIAAIEVPAQMRLLATQFGGSALIAANSLTPLLTKLDQVKTKITEIAGAMAALGNGGISINTSGGTNVPGRADGGSVFAGKLYEVAERGISELLQIGGRTYLIPGQNGTVIPPSAPPPTMPRGGGSSSVYNNQQFDGSVGSVIINITGGTTLTEEQLRQATARGIEDERRRNPIGRRLMLGGQT